MKVAFICYANYCRSPVAEKLLQKELGQGFSVRSYGLIQFNSEGMHTHSKDFLKKLGHTNILHTPSKLNEEHIKNLDIIYVVSNEILKILMNQYPLYSGKFKLMCPDGIPDPINLDKKKYFNVLEDISKECVVISKKLKKIF